MLCQKVHYGDGLPECICSNCYEQLIISNKFRLQCHAATDHLNKIRIAHEEEHTSLIKEEVSLFEENVSSSCDDMFNVTFSFAGPLN